MDAFIFDMDGVIVDSELHWKTMEGYALRSLVPAWGPPDQTRITGLSLHDLYRLLTSEYGVSQTKDEFAAYYLDLARDIYGHKVSLMDGFLELLDGLNSARVPVAVASSSTRAWIEIVLDRFDLWGHFDTVVSADELPGGRGKPLPDIYLHTAERLGVDPERCVVVEDSNNGVLSARAAGMYCIGLRNGFNDEQNLSAANRIIYTLRELDVASLAKALA